MRSFYLIRNDLGHITNTAHTLAAAQLAATKFDEILVVTAVRTVQLPRQRRSGYAKLGRTVRPASINEYKLAFADGQTRKGGTDGRMD